MPTKIIEFHGAPPLSNASMNHAASGNCPFVSAPCKKKKSGGVCTLAPMEGEPVIICPNRMYDNNYEVIRRIAVDCFGIKSELVTAIEAEGRRRTGGLTGNEVIVYGQGFSGEIGIKAPTADGETEGSFKVDFILVKIDEDLKPTQFLAIEVQTIDTTNSYSDVTQRYYSFSNDENDGSIINKTSAGFNWENVSKRILPQIIYKGHALRREAKAQFGLFFVLPHPVFEKIKARIGGKLLSYPKGLGTVTFHSYKMKEENQDGPRSIELYETLTTTVEQIAFAFVSPQNLPPLGIYNDILTEKLTSLRRISKI